MQSALSYPILLVHGMGYRDYKLIGYWGRIPKVLKEMGCKVYFGNQDSNASIETNAKHLADRINKVLEETGAEKVNILAHSKGGLDCRYAISSLGMGEKVASLTTLSTPHHGSKTVDFLLKFPRSLVRFGSFCTDLWFRILGDKNPETYKVICSFTTGAAEKFNAETPDFEGVFYQSYAFVMKSGLGNIFMLFPSIFVKLIEGENDGLLTPEAVKWGEFKGIFRSEGKRGISHCDEVDIFRRRFTKKRGEGISDIVDIYKDIVLDLKKRGF